MEKNRAKDILDTMKWLKKRPKAVASRIRKNLPMGLKVIPMVAWTDLQGFSNKAKDKIKSGFMQTASRLRHGSKVIWYGIKIRF